MMSTASVAAAATAEMVFLQRTKDSSDLSYKGWQVALCTQLMLCLSISTACIPYLRPFLDSLESGLLRSDDLRRRGMEGSYGYGNKKPERILLSKKSFISKNLSTSTKETASSGEILRNNSMGNSSIGYSTDEMPLRPQPVPINRTRIHADPHSVFNDGRGTFDKGQIILFTSWSVGEVHGANTNVETAR
jgi:hypothetical protein